VTHPLAALVLMPLMMLVGGLVGGLLTSLLVSQVKQIIPPGFELQFSAVSNTVMLVGTFLPMALLLLLWTGLYERRPSWTLGLERSGAVWRFGRGLLVGVALYAAALGICAALGYVSVQPADPQRQEGLVIQSVLLILLGWLVQGSTEELLCRGWLLPVIGARTRPWVGLLLSALVFAVLHGPNPNVTPLAILNLVLFGLFAGLYALREGGVWGIGALHAAWNWTQGSLFGIAVSGGEVGPSLFSLELRGPAAITGGAFGSEGGLAVTAVLLLGCGALLWLLRDERRKTNDERFLLVDR
jgi:membrane protease YdiL (CAAX protease family)